MHLFFVWQGRLVSPTSRIWVATLISNFLCAHYLTSYLRIWKSFLQSSVERRQNLVNSTCILVMCYAGAPGKHRSLAINTLECKTTVRPLTQYDSDVKRKDSEVFILRCQVKHILYKKLSLFSCFENLPDEERWFQHPEKRLRVFVSSQ